MRAQPARHQGGLLHRWCGLRGLVLGVVFAISATSAAHAEPALNGDHQAVTLGGPSSTSSDQRHRVTLLTGDVIIYTESAGGQSTISIESAPRSGSRPGFQTSSSPDGYLVVPSDVAPYLASGVVDPELFDVKEFVKEGLGDAASDKLPVIVSYDANVPAAAVTGRADDLPASDRTVTLPSVHAAAVR
jgi:hypothetical protein